MSESPSQEHEGDPMAGHDPMGELDMMSEWTLDLEMTGDSPEDIVKALNDVILTMLQGGIYHAGAMSQTTGVAVHYTLRRTVPRGLYLDGEGTLVAVDEDGDVAGLIAPDGKEDDTVTTLRLDAQEWGRQHGGLVDARHPSRQPTIQQIEHMTQKTIGNLGNLIKGWLGEDQEDEK